MNPRTKLGALSLLAAFAAAAAIGKAADPPSGHLTATATSVVVAAGQLGETTLTWTTSNCSTAEVHLVADGGPEQLFARSPQGSGKAPWIAPGHSYVFRLTAETDDKVLLESITVLGVPPSGGTLVGGPTSCPVPPGGLGTATLTWATDQNPDAEVRVLFLGQEGILARAPSGTATAPWIQLGQSYDFELFSGPGASTLLATLHVTGVAGAPAPPPSYEVGVDYHMTGADLAASGFLRRYDQPGVRALVQQQLQDFADRGARFVSTRVWMVSKDPDPAAFWEWHFPPSAQEIANLTQYAQDVAAIRAKDGHALSMDLCTLWLWAASYTQGSPSTTLGYENLSAADFTANVNASVDAVLGAVKDVKGADGKPLVQTFYFDGEVMAGLGLDGKPPKPNTDWFLATHYPRFVAKVQAAGLVPSLYLSVAADESAILNDSYKDPVYSVCDGHLSMIYVYRTLKTMQDLGLPLPPRMDASTYVNATSASYDTLVKRIYDDADAVCGSLGMPRRYGVAETYYYQDATKRQALGQAFANEATLRGRLVRTAFWPTDDATAGDAAPPFVIEDFLPKTP